VAWAGSPWSNSRSSKAGISQTKIRPWPSSSKLVNLTKRYGSLVALSNLNLEINEGDCFGFIGPNGAGKTHDQDPGDAAPADVGRRRASATSSSAIRSRRSAR
jgi:ABC-type molybdenum transport system ATPase subunit/photorepair protein PhrA